MNSNFKNIYYALFLIFALGGLFSYRYFIHHMIDNYKQLRLIQTSVQDTNNIEAQLIAKKQTLDVLNDRLFKFDTSRDAFNILTGFCSANSVKLDYKTPKKVQIDNVAKIENEIIVEGEFKSIVELMYLIENEFGWVESCSFYKENRRVNNRVFKKLKAKIYFSYSEL